MGHPKDASGCHCVLSLCHLMYCHLPNISPWRLRRFPKSKSHLITTYPATALCTWRIQNHQTTFHRGCSFTHSASDHPSTPPPVVPTGRFWGPLAQAVHSIHGGARCEKLLHDGGVAVVSRVVQRCLTSGAEGLGDFNGWRAPPRGSPPPTPTLHWRGSNLWSEVREFHLFQNCIASWLNGSRYYCWCLWRPPRLRTDGTFHNRKSEKRENRFLTPKKTYLNTSQAFSSALLHPYSSRPN